MKAPILVNKVAAAIVTCLHGTGNQRRKFFWAYGSFRKLGVPYFGVLIIRILLFRVLYSSQSRRRTRPGQLIMEDRRTGCVSDPAGAAPARAREEPGQGQLIMVFR